MKIHIVKDRQRPESTWSSPKIVEYHVILSGRSTFEYLNLQHEMKSPNKGRSTKECIEYVRNNTTMRDMKAQVKLNINR